MKVSAQAVNRKEVGVACSERFNPQTKLLFIWYPFVGSVSSETTLNHGLVTYKTLMLISGFNIVTLK